MSVMWCEVIEAVQPVMHTLLERNLK